MKSGIPLMLSLFLVMASALQSASSTCPVGQFFDLSLNRCCSECPVNEIIRSPCTKVKDTACGPFYEFQSFNQGPDETLDLVVPSREAYDNESDEESNRKVGVVINEISHGSPQTKVPSVQSDDVYWRELCFGLIGALALVTLSLLLYIVFIQIRARRTLRKTVTVQDPENPSMYYHAELISTVRPPSDQDPAASPFRNIEKQLEDNQTKRTFASLFDPKLKKFNKNEYTDRRREPVAVTGPFLLSAISEAGDESADLVYVPAVQNTAPLPGSRRGVGSSQVVDV